MNNPSISEVSYYPLKPNERGLIGIASLVFDNKLSLNSISVYTTTKGDIKLLFPDHTLRNGKVINVYYPINKETYELMRKAVAKKLQEVVEKAKGHYSDASNIKPS